MTYSNDPPGMELFIEDEAKIDFGRQVISYLEVLGMGAIRARLPGFVPPETIVGTQRNYRPDIVAIQSNEKNAPAIIELVMRPRDLVRSRLTLFNSMRMTWGSDLFIACPSNIPDIAQKIRSRLSNGPTEERVTPQGIIVI